MNILILNFNAMFEKVLAAVMGFIGVSAFAKNADGKSEMTSDQEKRLTDKWGSKFVEEFKNDLLEYEKNGNAAEDAVTAEKLAEMEAEKEKYAKELKETKEKIVSLESEKKEFQATIAKLEKQEIPDTGIHVSEDKGQRTNSSLIWGYCIIKFWITILMAIKQCNIQVMEQSYGRT